MRALFATGLVGLLLLQSAWACSFGPGYTIFRFNPNATPMSGERPGAPEIELKFIHRGFNDGDFASCSDAGIISFAVPANEPRGTVGYSFRVQKGSIEDGIFPLEVVTPVELNDGSLGFFFVWLDARKPIDAEIEVRLVSESGLEGEAIVVKLEHPSQ